MRVSRTILVIGLTLIETPWAFGQGCPFAEPAATSCSAARLIPGDPGQHVILTDASTATGTGTFCYRTVGKVVWFQVTPVVSGPMTISTCHPGTAYDTILQVYSGGEPGCDVLGPIEDCEDDSPGPFCDNGCSFQGSTITLNAVAGTLYRIAVGAYNSNSAGCPLCLGLIVTIGTPCGDPPTNLFCSEAQELPGIPGTHQALADVAEAIPDPSGWSCEGGTITVGHSVWYMVQPTVSGALTFTTCHPNTAYDTVLRAFTGTCGGILGQIACSDDDANDAACENPCAPGARRGSTVTIDATPGSTYYFEVGAYGGDPGACPGCLGVRAVLTEAECTGNGDCDDGNECTQNLCSGGTCIYPDEPNGTPCGSGADTACDNPDTCQSGTCRNNLEPSGTRCADDGNECTIDVCDGDGSCTHPPQSDGTACADDGNPCTSDACTAGSCAHPNRPNGTACGSGADTACDNPDACLDGACQANVEPSGTPCPDDGNPCTDDRCDGIGLCAHPNRAFGKPCSNGWFCDGDESCDGLGACRPGTPPCMPEGVCMEDTDRCVADCNRNGIPDRDEPEAPGLVVTQAIRAGRDTYVDSSAPDTNFSGENGLVGTFLAIGAEQTHAVPAYTETWIAFDVSVIPPEAMIVEATLRATVRVGGYGPDSLVAVHPAVGPWLQEELTWATQPATGPAASIQIFEAAATELSLDVTALAREWIGETTENHGLVLRSSGTGAHWTRFIESGDSGRPPTLSVTYSLPACSSTFAGVTQLVGFGPPAENPVAGLPVSLWGAMDPGESGAEIATTRTDRQGRFRLHHLLFAEQPYERYTLVVEETSYRVESVLPGPNGQAGPDGTIRYDDVAAGAHEGNIFYLEPAFYPALVTRVFTGLVAAEGSLEPQPGVEVVLYGADDPAVSARVLAGASTAEDGAFRLTIESEPQDVYPYYVVQVADYEYEVTRAGGPPGSVYDENRIVFDAPEPGDYGGIEFEVRPKGAAAQTAVAGVVAPRPVLAVVLTPQCICTGCADCDPNRCRNITNPNVLTAFGQSVFSATGDSVHRFFLEMSQGRLGLQQAGLFQVVPPDLPNTPNFNESTLCGGFPSPERHRAYVAANVLGQQLQFNFANFDNDGDGVVEEDELIVLIAVNDPFSNARMRTSDPATVQVGNVGVRVYYPLVALGQDFYTIAHELAHAMPYTLQSDIPGDLYGGAGNAGAYSLMDNHCHGDVGQRDPNTPWNAVQRINNARYPHLDPWNKIQLGWLTPTTVTTDQWVTFDAVSNATGRVYKLQTAAHGDKEYFLIENRWAAGSTYDTNLPSSGLAIWHVNENYLPDQRRAVALERAGGGANSGASTDFCNDDRDNTALWSGWHDFHPDSLPDSDWDNGTESGIAVLCIGPPGPAVNAYVSTNWSQRLKLEDPLEPNNSFPLARTVALPGSYNLSIHAPCDKDFFTFTTADYQNVDIVAEGFHDPEHFQPGPAPMLTLLEAQGYVLGSGQGAISRHPLKPGTWHLEVTSSTLIYYTLVLTTTPVTIAPDVYDDQSPPGEPRNDTRANAAVLPHTFEDTPYPIASAVLDLNHDTPADIDYFTIQLPPATDPVTGHPECCPTPLDPDETQGHFRILVFADTYRPFNITLYNSDGTTFDSTNGLSYSLDCPHNSFPDGRITFSLRDPAGRNIYQALVGYSRCYFRFYPGWFLEYDPPLLRWSIPAFPDRDIFVFPIDPEIRSRYLAGEITEPFPPEFGVFDWPDTRAYSLTVRAIGFVADLPVPIPFPLGVALVDDDGNVVAQGTPGVAAGVEPPAAHLEVPALPAGQYFLRVSDGPFGTRYELDIEVEGDIDGNATVDLRDVAVFQQCFGAPATMVECERADLDGSDFVDMPDVSPLVAALTGPH